MSAGQGIGAIAGAVVGSIIPGVGTMVGMSIGYALGGVVDPPVPDPMDPTGSAYLRFNTFSNQLPVPVAYGRVLHAGNCVFIGTTAVTKEREGGGKGEPDTITVVYDADFFVVLSEGEIQEVHAVYRGEDDVTDDEGDVWDWRAGTDDASTPSEVLEIGVQQPHGWRRTAGIMWHGRIGLSPTLPVIAAEFTGIDTTKTWSGSAGTALGLTGPTWVFWDHVSRKLVLKDGNTLVHTPRDHDGITDVTGYPSSILTPAAWAVNGLEQLVLWVDTYDTERRFAMGPIGDDGTGTDWVEGTFSESSWQYDIVAFTFDAKWSRLYVVVENTDDSTIEVIRYDMLDGTEEVWTVPDISTANFACEGIFVDKEYDEVYLVGHDGVSERDFVRGRFGGSLVETNSIPDTSLGEVSGMGRSGDFLTGLDVDNGSIWRFVWNDTTTFENEVDSVADPRVTTGALTAPSYAYYASEFNKLIILDTVSGDWVAVFTEWGYVNWSYTDDDSYNIVRFGSPSCPAGAIYDFFTNEVYGARAPAARIDVYTFECVAGYCSEKVLNGDSDQSVPTYASRWTCDLVINEKSNLLSDIEPILATFAGWLTDHRGKVALGCERPCQLISARITEADIIEDSLVWGGTDYLARPNCVRIDFLDKTQQYIGDQAKVDNEFEQEQYGEVKERNFRIVGITDRVRALRMARFLLDLASASDDITSFSRNIEGALTDVGDFFLVNHEAAGKTNEIVRVVRIQETDSYEYAFAAIRHVPEVYQTPQDDEIQKPTWGDNADLGYPNPGDQILPIARMNVIEDHYTPSVMILFSFGSGAWDGLFKEARFERGALSTGPFTKLVGKSSAPNTSWLLHESIDDDDTTLDVSQDTSLGAVPDNGDEVFLVIDDEIMYGEYVSSTTGFQNLLRGQRGTTAVAHEVADVTIEVIYEYDASEDMLNDLTTDLTDGSLLTYENILVDKDDELYIGCASIFNRIDLSVVGNGDDNRILLYYSSSVDGEWTLLPGRRGQTYQLQNSGYLTFSMPSDWVATHKRTASEDFTDTTDYFYIKLVQVNELGNRFNFTTHEEEPNTDDITVAAEVTAKRAPVVFVLDIGEVLRWTFAEEEKFTQWYVRSTAISPTGQISEDDHALIKSILIQDLYRTDGSPDQLRGKTASMGPFPPSESHVLVSPAGEDVVFYWNLEVISGGYGQFGYGSAPPGYGGSESETIAVYEYQIEVGGVVVREGEVTDQTYTYSSASNTGDNGTFQQVFTFRVRTKSVSGVTSSWSEITTEAL